MPPAPGALRDSLAELGRHPVRERRLGARGGRRGGGVEWVAARIRDGGGSAEVVPWGVRPSARDRRGAGVQRTPTRRPRSSATRTSTYSRPTRSSSEESPPFELTARDGRLYARGVADDKVNLLVLVEAASQLAAAGELPVNVRFAFDGEEEVGGDSIVQWVEQDDGPADAALILDGSMIRRGLPAFAIAVRGMLYFHLRVRTGTTDMHSGMFGSAALNASHALDGRAPRGPARPGRAGSRVAAGGWYSRDRRGARSLGAASPGGEQLAQYGAVPIAPGAADEFYVRTFAGTSLDVNGFASGSPDLVKTVLPVEARANVSIRLAPDRTRK